MCEPHQLVCFFRLYRQNHKMSEVQQVQHEMGNYLGEAEEEEKICFVNTRHGNFIELSISLLLDSTFKNRMNREQDLMTLPVNTEI